MEYFDFLTGSFSFLVGVCVGSFLNVVILRYNTGFSINGRSSCFTCGAKLLWGDLVPVLSFIFLGGKCRTCKTKISWQYPLVEFGTGVLFFLIYLKGFSLSLTLYYCIIWSILVLITVYDLRHKIIPDMFAYLFALLAFLKILFEIYTIGFDTISFVAILTGPIFFLPFFCLWFFSNGEWMGLGDGKLALGIGWFLGLSQGIVAIVLAFWIGAFISLILLFLKKFVLSKSHSPLSKALKKITIQSEIPFAPFLIVGIFLVFFFGIETLHLAPFLTLQ